MTNIHGLYVGFPFPFHFLSVVVDDMQELALKVSDGFNSSIKPSQEVLQYVSIGSVWFDFVLINYKGVYVLGNIDIVPSSL